MSAARAVKIIAAMFAGFLLSCPHAAFAQDSDEATRLNQQVIQLFGQGHYSEAITLAQRALAIREKALGPDHPDVAQSLNNLASLYQAQGRYEDAEPLSKRSLAIREKALGPDHRDVAVSLNSLAVLYNSQGRYAEAEPLYKRSLAIREKAFGPDHPDVATALNNLAELYRTQGRYADAEPLYERSLTIREKALGPDHRDVANSLNSLAELYRTQGRYADAEPLYQRSLAIREKALGLDHPDVATLLNNLALLYNDRGRYAEAEPLYRRSLAIREKALGPDHPYVGLSLNNLAALYDNQGRYAEAEPLYKRSLAIREKVLGLGHPEVANSLNNLALLYDNQGRYADAEPLYKRSLAIREKALGPDHRDVATVLNNLAELYRTQGRYADAEPLYKRSLAIQEKALGSNHPQVAILLNNMARLYFHQDRYADALPVVRTAAQRGFTQKQIYLAILNGAVTKSLVTTNDAVSESYQVVQQATSSAASNAINQLSVRFAVGNDQLAQLVRKDQDLSAESDRLDKSVIEAVSNEPAKRDADNEQKMRDRSQAIAAERNQLQATLNQRFPDFAALSRPQPVSVKDTAVLLADDEALIVIDVDKTSYVWVVTRDKSIWKKLDVTSDDLDKMVNQLRASLDAALAELDKKGSITSPFDTKAAYVVYKSTFGAVEDVISSKKRLSVVVTGALTSIPPQILVTSDPTGKDYRSADWLMRNYAVTIFPSVASIKILRSKTASSQAPKPMIGYGNPAFQKGGIGGERGVALNRSITSYYRGITVDTDALSRALPALPETADELRAVANSVKASDGDIRLGAAASEALVKQEKLDDYRIVYFATHALVAGQTELFVKANAEPAIALSIPAKATDFDDGLLTASEVAQLKLNADWVVLSACNTVAGEKPGAEALSGLARAFFYAGARSMLVSHWSVLSNTTVQLMTGTFDEIAKDPKLSNAEALRRSMLALMNDPKHPEWSHPIYWAPFVVVGEATKRQ